MDIKVAATFLSFLFLSLICCLCMCCGPLQQMFDTEELDIEIKYKQTPPIEHLELQNHAADKV